MEVRGSYAGVRSVQRDRIRDGQIVMKGFDQRTQEEGMACWSKVTVNREYGDRIGRGRWPGRALSRPRPPRKCPTTTKLRLKIPGRTAPAHAGLSEVVCRVRKCKSASHSL